MADERDKIPARSHLHAQEDPGEGLAPDALEELFRARAARLARRPLDKPVEKRTSRVLVFRVAGERFALRLTDVSGIAPAGAVGAVPLSPPEVRGVVLRDGKLVTVLETAVMLGLTDSVTDEDSGFLLFLQRERTGSGFRVSEVHEIAELSTAALRGTHAGAPAGHTVMPDGLSLLDTSLLLGHPILAASHPTTPPTHRRREHTRRES